MPPPSLQSLASLAVAARLAKEGSYLAQVVASAPLSLVAPCLVAVEDPLALAAVEDACCCGDASGSQGGRELLEVHWRRLFLLRFGNKNGALPLFRWRLRYEAAEAAERAKLESLGLKLREREREEAERKRARSVVVLQAPPRPLLGSKSSSSFAGNGNTKRRSSGIDPRQRIAKKLASGSMAARSGAAATAVAARAAAATAAAAAARAPSSSFPNLARPLVNPGNEAVRIRRTSSSSGGNGGGHSVVVGGNGRKAPVELEEVSLFD